jgi:hypothetical protein
MMRARLWIIVAVVAAISRPAVAADLVLLYAAGSLRGSLSEIEAFETVSGTTYSRSSAPPAC